MAGRGKVDMRYLERNWALPFSFSIVFAPLSALSSPASAVPSFAVQTGQPCAMCHVGGFGPQLTQFGRDFKIGGYTNRAVNFNVPLSAQVIASYVHTKADQNPPAAPNVKPNDNFALDQVGLFLAGGVGNHLGGFVQVTYQGIAKAWTWDNLDLRAVTTSEVAGAPVVFGASFNNSPGIDDPWNTLPVWGFVYTGSVLRPSPATAPLFSGALAQTTLGLTGYAWIDGKVYIEAGGYRSPAASLLSSFGVDPTAPGEINGIAPYARIAYQKAVGAGDAQIGAFLLSASLYPGRDRSTGFTDRYTDLGVDASYQLPRENGDVFSVNARYTHESQALRASFALGNATNVNDSLDDIRIDASYYYRNKIGATVGVFDTTGSFDPLLFTGRTGRPDSQGVTIQLDGTPFGSGSPLGSRFNVRVGVQYTAYTRFDGARTNYDGAGANASDNNTVRVFTWFAF